MKTEENERFSEADVSTTITTSYEEMISLLLHFQYCIDIVLIDCFEVRFWILVQ